MENTSTHVNGLFLGEVVYSWTTPRYASWVGPQKMRTLEADAEVAQRGPASGACCCWTQVRHPVCTHIFYEIDE